MKVIRRGLIAVLLLIASSTVVRAGDVPIQDEPLPPEVKKLIGMKIPPRVVGRSGGSIPNFTRFSAGLLNKKFGNIEPKAELSYSEGIVQGKWPAFFVEAIFEDRTREILDARLLPKNKINWRYKNGETTRLEEGDFLIFSPYCKSEPKDGRIIFGLEDPKFELNNFSTRIERAWEIDPQTGNIKNISNEGIVCAILGE